MKYLLSFFLFENELKTKYARPFFFRRLLRPPINRFVNLRPSTPPSVAISNHPVPPIRSFTKVGK